MSTDTTQPLAPAPAVQPRPEHDGLAIASFVSAFFVSPAAIVLGHMSNHRAKKARRPKSGLAIAGLILGYIGTIGGILLLIVLSASASSYQSAIDQATQPPAVATAPASPAPATPAESTPAAGTYNAPVGSTLTLTDDSDGTQWTVRVNSVKTYHPGEYDTAPPAGTHYVVASVTYHAVTGTAHPNPLDWASKAANGQTHDPEYLGSGTMLDSDDIQAGQTVTGDVYLVIPDSGGSTAVYSAGLSEAGSWTIPASA